MQTNWLYEDQYSWVKKDKNALTINEFILIEKEKPLEYWAMLIGFYTRIRINKVILLEKEEFDFDKNTIYIHWELNYKRKKIDIETVKQTWFKSSKALIPLSTHLKKN